SAATATSRVSPPSTPSLSSFNHRASNASGRAASSVSAKDHHIRLGSWRKPSLHTRHIDWIGGGSGSIPPTPLRPPLDEGNLGPPPLGFRPQPLRLQVEHRAIAATQRHQLVVGTQLDDFAML